MKRKKRMRSRREDPQAAPAGVPEEQLQGPPAPETVEPPDAGGRRERGRREELTDTDPRLSGGDVDADWQRAAHAGEEAVGGTVATPDQDIVDELNEALGVPRAPDEEFRPSSEILEGRDRFRWEEEEE